MKLINQSVGYGAVMLAIAWSAWAVGQAGGQGVGGKDQLNPAVPVSSVPVMFMPATSGANVAGRMSPFSSKVSADFFKKVMETSARIEAAKRQIAERQAQLYANNPEIKSIRARMIEGQKEINKILDKDPELAELKMSRDILWSTMPALPKGRNPSSMPRMPVVR